MRYQSRSLARVAQNRSARSPEFLNAIERWLAVDTDLLVLNRRTRAAGAKDWFLIRSLTELNAVVTRAQPSDCLTVFAGRQLPHRGLASASLLAAALAVVENNEESVFGEIVPADPRLKDSLAAGASDRDWVEEWIRDRWNHEIAFGPYPPYLSNDPNVAVDGIVPMDDGTVVVGVY